MSEGRDELAWIVVGETLRVQSDELEGLISIRGDMDFHGAFEIVFLKVSRPRKPLNITTPLQSRFSRIVMSIYQSTPVKASSYKDRRIIEDWPSQTHSAVMQDIGGGPLDSVCGTWE